MSIAPVRKVTLFGLAADKIDALAGLQALGTMHVLPLASLPAEPENAPSARAEDALKALRFLSQAPHHRRPVRHDPSFDMAAVVRRTLHTEQALRTARDRRDTLQRHLKELEPWGTFTLPDLSALDGHRLWFYTVPLTKLDQLPADIPTEIVHRSHRLAHVVVVAREEPPPAAMPVPRAHVGPLALAEVHHQLDLVENHIEDLAAEREHLTRWLHLMRRNLAAADDAAALRAAADQTLDDDQGVFAVQGWVPVADLSGVEALAERTGLACLVEAPGLQDTPPTLLQNSAPFDSAQDVVNFYKTPPYGSWDPSAVLFVSFAIFFAMIMADAGYGLMLLLLIGLFRTSFGGSPAGRRLRTLGLVLAGSTVAYGVLIGGYFGLNPPTGTWLARLAVIDLNDYGAMMRLSILIGCLHLIVALGVVAWRAATPSGRWQPVGWIGGILGGLALWQGATPVGAALTTAGLATVLAFGSDRPVHRRIDLLWRGLDGLLALTRVTSAFGDVLSYMRLFALGLAGSSLALTFNRLAEDLATGLPGPGLFLAMLLLLLGHSLNLALCLMSGVVHGLRLNFIEFFNWGLAGEGTPFRRFAKREGWS